MRVKRIFAGAGVLLLPFILEVGQPDEMRLPKAKFLLLLSLLYGCYELTKKIDWALGLFGAWVAVSSYYSIVGFPFEDVALFYGALFSSFWVARLSTDDIFFGLKLFLVPAVILMVYADLQHLGKDPFATYYAWADAWRPNALFGQSTLYGPYAVCGFLVALFLERYVVAAFLLFPIIAIDSSFTYLSLLGGVFLWLAGKLKRWMLLTLLLSSFLLSLLAYSTHSSKIEEALNDKGRFVLWGQTLELAMRHPVMGYGFGSFKTIYPMFQLPELRKANGLQDQAMSEHAKEFFAKAEHLKAESGVFVSSHNDLLQLFFETGAVGVILVLVMAARFLLAYRRNCFRPGYPVLGAMLAAVVLNSLGNFPFHLVPQALIPLWIYVIVLSRDAILRPVE